MDDWVSLDKLYSTDTEAKKVAGILEIAESRLSNPPKGPQYNIETEVYKENDGWKVRWRKVLTGFKNGCAGCGSCNSNEDQAKKEDFQKSTAGRMGKIIEFKPRNN